MASQQFSSSGIDSTLEGPVGAGTAGREGDAIYWMWFLINSR